MVARSRLSDGGAPITWVFPDDPVGFALRLDDVLSRMPRDGDQTVCISLPRGDGALLSALERRMLNRR
jgi:hypothetical protein